MLFILSFILVVIVAVFVGLWSADANHPIRYNPEIKGPVLLVFAHPDDEAMFFTPILQYMRRVNIQVSLLCLTTGDAVGLGKVRERELVKSAAYYGIPASRVTTLDVPQFRDGMKEVWDAEKVAQAVQRHIVMASPDGGSSSSYFHTVLTFDSAGVSSHPNHISTYHGVRLLAQKERLKEEPQSLTRFYTLRTHPIIVKYGGLISLWGTLLWGPEGRLVEKSVKQLSRDVQVLGEGPMGEMLGKSERKYQHMQAQHDKYRSKERSTWVVLIRPTQVLSSLMAMMEHKSQLVWFRYAFVFLSSYTYYNVVDELQ